MSFLYPGEYIDSTYSIDFDKLYKEGYRGVIFDIDNTLVTHGSPADERAIALFTHLKELGFSCMLLSNNKEPRVKMFNDAVHVNYMYKAGKPKPLGYRKAMETLGTNTTNTIFVGDQIFTDVVGANLPLKLEEAQALSDCIGIMKDGRLLAVGTPEALIRKAGTSDFESAFVFFVKEGHV